MRQTEFVVRAAKGDRIVKTFLSLKDLESWLERREAETQHVPVRVTMRQIIETPLDLAA